MGATIDNESNTRITAPEISTVDVIRGGTDMIKSFP